MSMKPATRLLLLAAVTICGVIAASPASAYAVICRFSFRSHAEDFARSNGMLPGRACSCR